MGCIFKQHKSKFYNVTILIFMSVLLVCMCIAITGFTIPILGAQETPLYGLRTLLKRLSSFSERR